MELNLIKENEDGSADYAINLSEKEKDNLIRWAVIKAITNFFEEGKKYDPSEYGMDYTSGRGKDSVHGSGEQSSESEQSADSFKTSQVLG
jgi:hypothetical protein